TEGGEVIVTISPLLHRGGVRLLLALPVTPDIHSATDVDSAPYRLDPPFRLTLDLVPPLLLDHAGHIDNQIFAIQIDQAHALRIPPDHPNAVRRLSVDDTIARDQHQFIVLHHRLDRHHLPRLGSGLDIDHPL